MDTKAIDETIAKIRGLKKAELDALYQKRADLEQDKRAWVELFDEEIASIQAAIDELEGRNAKVGSERSSESSRIAERVYKFLSANPGKLYSSKEIMSAVKAIGCSASVVLRIHIASQKIIEHKIDRKHSRYSVPANIPAFQPNETGLDSGSALLVSSI